MKQSEYIPISVRESIEDRNIAKIVDFFERVGKDFIYVRPVRDIRVDGFIIPLGSDFIKIYDRQNQVAFYGPTKLLADNIVGIWGSLKNL